MSRPLRIEPWLEAVGDRLGQGLRRLAADPELVKNLTLFEWIKTIPMAAN